MVLVHFCQIFLIFSSYFLNGVVFVRPVYASSFDAIFVAVSTAIFVVPALQIQITCVQTTYSFSAISAREIFQSFEHAPNVMQLGSDFQKM